MTTIEEHHIYWDAVYLKRLAELTSQNQTKTTMNPPQSVTTRYVTNLLIHGQNDTFGLMSIKAEATIVGNANIGTHYIASVGVETEPDSKHGYGATPLAAVRRALECWGVTFR